MSASHKQKLIALLRAVGVGAQFGSLIADHGDILNGAHDRGYVWYHAPSGMSYLTKLGEETAINGVESLRAFYRAKPASRMMGNA